MTNALYRPSTARTLALYTADEDEDFTIGILQQNPAVQRPWMPGRPQGELPPRGVTLGPYSVRSVLGSGATGSVFGVSAYIDGLDAPPQNFAMKITEPQPVLYAASGRSVFFDLGSLDVPPPAEFGFSNAMAVIAGAGGNGDGGESGDTTEAPMEWLAAQGAVAGQQPTEPIIYEPGMPGYLPPTDDPTTMPATVPVVPASASAPAAAPAGPPPPRGYVTARFDERGPLLHVPLAKFMRELAGAASALRRVGSRGALKLHGAHCLLVAKPNGMMHASGVLLYEHMDGDGATYTNLLSQATNVSRTGKLRRVFIMLSQTAGALDSLHRQNIYHGDLKPQNIMYTARRGVRGDAVFRLADFDMVCSPSVGDRVGPTALLPLDPLLGQEEINELELPGCRASGTLTFMAPEYREAFTRRDSRYTTAEESGRADVYSFGRVARAAFMRVAPTVPPAGTLPADLPRMLGWLQACTSDTPSTRPRISMLAALLLNYLSAQRLRDPPATIMRTGEPVHWDQPDAFTETF